MVYHKFSSDFSRWLVIALTTYFLRYYQSSAEESLNSNSQPKDISVVLKGIKQHGLQSDVAQ